MAEAQRRRWTLDEYMAWEAEQPTKHEFVDGTIRSLQDPPHAMVGGTGEHDIIGNNLRGILRDRLRGQRCRVHGPEMKVATGNGNIRYPDALIACGPFVRGMQLAAEPVAVFEMLSHSTAWVDQALKLRDYAATPCILHYVLISQDEVRAVAYGRDEAGGFERSAKLIEGEGATIELSSLGLVIPLADLYEGLDG
jgi:Uma2 family endonuclease